MKLELRAVLTGAFVDLGATTFFNGIAITAFAAIHAAQGSASGQIYAELYSARFVAFVVFTGLLMNMLGGYVSAATAQRRHLLLGGLSAVPCLFLGLFALLNPLPSYFPLWSVLVGWFFCIPFGLLGGHLASRRKSK